MMNPNIGELVSAVIDGELCHYGEIVRHFDDQVRRFVHRQVRSESVTEDIVQETFYRAFKNLKTLRDPDQLESWLIMIARNCVKDYFRTLIRKEQQEAEYNERTAGRMFEKSNEDTSWVWQEVATLSPIFSEVLALRYQQRMSYDEIAQALELPQSTVRGRIHEGRKLLRQRLKEKGLFP